MSVFSYDAERVDKDALRLAQIVWQMDIQDRNLAAYALFMVCREQYPKLLLHSLVSVQPLAHTADVIFALDPPNVKSWPVIARPQMLLGRGDARSGGEMLGYALDTAILRYLIEASRKLPDTPTAVSKGESEVNTRQLADASCFGEPGKVLQLLSVPENDWWLLVGYEGYKLIRPDLLPGIAVHVDTYSKIVGSYEWVFGHRSPRLDSGFIWSPHILFFEKNSQVLTSYAYKLLGTKGFAHGSFRLV